MRLWRRIVRAFRRWARLTSPSGDFSHYERESDQ